MQLTRKVNIEFVGDDTFIMDFTSPVDRKRVLHEGPWNLFRDLIVIKESQGFNGPGSMHFDKITIWVQCNNVPIAIINRNILEKIGSQIGEVEELDEVNEDRSWDGLCG